MAGIAYRCRAGHAAETARAVDCRWVGRERVSKERAERGGVLVVFTWVAMSVRRRGFCVPYV